jgi:hypothetical protein
MSTFSIERDGFVDCQVLVKQLFTDLEANGFIRKFPNPISPLSPTDYKAVYEAGATVDALAPGMPSATPAIPAGSAVIAGAVAQPWRLIIEAPSASRIILLAGTPIQLGDSGTTTLLDNGFEMSGHMGKVESVAVVPATFPVTYINSVTPFYNRANLDVSQAPSCPMSYRLTITNHGVSLFIWEAGNDHIGNTQSWFVVQRLVNNTNGTPRIVGKAPVVCVYGIRYIGGTMIGTVIDTQTGKPKIETIPAVKMLNRFTVRESDITRPTISIPADLDSADSSRIINSQNSVAITEDNNYVISFPNGLNTNRFAYPVDELDMIAYTSADVVSQNADINITVYNEATPRGYKAMSASDIDNTGLRMLVLSSGG